MTNFVRKLLKCSARGPIVYLYWSKEIHSVNQQIEYTSEFHIKIARASKVKNINININANLKNRGSPNKSGVGGGNLAP